MSTYRQPQSVSTQLSQIVKLDGNLQGTLDIVKGTLTRPIEAKDKVLASQSDQYVKGFNPKDIAADWDSLSDLACATIKLTLSDILLQQYQTVKLASRLFTTIVNAYEKNTCARSIKLQEAFWNACHELNEPITLWIGRITIAANHLISAKQLPTDQQIADCLVGGLNNSWSSIRDTVVYSSVELLLDNTIAALEGHEVAPAVVVLIIALPTVANLKAMQKPKLVPLPQSNLVDLTLTPTTTKTK
ncbi:hypothetical protein PSTG_10689 [Puccinia striiformis f. sp. tritici PST-78]|uniref:Uncharacterized protein n=1 Tax=Puccinia striiformis f. sp. tritici PST-78 TaxID=1165861 RepID=A0A0L0V9P7_9BASI|nr:hypothetical protein PSTG_10689 [Puccinia striiformis f. sp. tritici PST-78]